MDADGDYIPRSVVRGNVRSIVAWNEWKVVKYKGTSKCIPIPTNEGIHRSLDVLLDDAREGGRIQEH